MSLRDGQLDIYISTLSKANAFSRSALVCLPLSLTEEQKMNACFLCVSVAFRSAIGVPHITVHVIHIMYEVVSPFTLRSVRAGTGSNASAYSQHLCTYYARCIVGVQSCSQWAL